MSKNLPLNTIRQASDDKILRLLTGNTLAETEKTPSLLTPKEKQALIEEAIKRKIAGIFNRHYGLVYDIRFLRIDLTTAKWQHQYMEAEISQMLQKWIRVAQLYTTKELEPKNQDQVEYRDKVIKIDTPDYKVKNPEEWLKEWEITAIRLKQFILEIGELAKLSKYPILSETTIKDIETNRFLFSAMAFHLHQDLDLLIDCYNTSKKFKLWLNNQGVKRKHLKRAIAMIDKHIEGSPNQDEMAMTLKDFGERKNIDITDGLEDFLGKVQIENTGLSEKDLEEVKTFIDKMRAKYGIN